MLPAILLMNVLAISGFFAIAAIWWDGWWHVTLGRDSFFIPPHLVIYAGIGLFFLSALALYRQTRSKTYLITFTGIAVMIVMAPVDQLWHKLFGAENLTSPLIVWSPPHLIAILASTFGLFSVLTAWIQVFDERDGLAFFRIALIAGAVLSMIHFLVFPLLPFGWYHSVHIWGVVISSFAVISYLLFLVRNLPNRGLATITVMIVLLFFSFKAISVASDVRIPSYAPLPQWLHFFAMIIPAMFFDFVNIRKLKTVVVGLTGGGLFYFIYFICWGLISSELPYVRMDIFIFMLGGISGGAMAGFLVQKLESSGLIKLIRSS